MTIYVHAQTNGKFAWLHLSDRRVDNGHATRCGKILVRWMTRANAENLPPHLALCPLCSHSPLKVLPGKLEPGVALEAFDGYWWLYDGEKWQRLPRLQEAEKIWLRKKEKKHDHY